MRVVVVELVDYPFVLIPPKLLVVSLLEDLEEPPERHLSDSHHTPPPLIGAMPAHAFHAGAVREVYDVLHGFLAFAGADLLPAGKDGGSAAETSIGLGPIADIAPDLDLRYAMPLARSQRLGFGSCRV